MLRLLSRDEALAAIRAETGTPACLMCAIRNATRDGSAGRQYVVHEDDEQLVLLPRYVRRIGHLLVFPRVHVTSFADVDDAVWARTSLLALRAARVIEQVVRPLRVYVASTGSSAGELTQSSTHLHVHAIPLYEPDDKPASIFSWEQGVYAADHEVWEDLRGRYAAAWKKVTE